MTPTATLSRPSHTQTRAGPASPSPARTLEPPTPEHDRRAGDWPHTTRAVPWLVAAFIAMLWLVPFDTISLTVSLPFDLHLDRIVLPFVILACGVTFLLGRTDRPTLRLTWVHVAVGAFLLLAFVSVLVNTGSLNESLELGDAIKSLLLLGSYVAFFLVIATSVRRGEVRAFLDYTLILAVLCGIGTLVEFRFHYNVFYSLSSRLLPSIFKTLPPNNGGVDEIGRPVVLGPGEVGLEVASMLAMAVPLALVGLITARRRSEAIWYGLASCVVLAAGLATYKKTALVAPAAVALLLVILLPRRSLRFTPLIVVMILGAHVLAPGALGSVIEQFTGGRLNDVGTTQHRQAGYDAIRPLVWAHPLLGMGYGTYNGELNRILDNQMLDNLIDTGVLGELLYILMAVSVVAAAWPLIRARGGGDASVAALGAGLTAVVFLLVSFLFDAMEFPHVPYIFLTAAGLVAVLAADVGGVPRKPAGARHAARR